MIDWLINPTTIAIVLHESRKTRRKQLAKNNWSKILGRELVEKQLTEKSQAENSSQEQKVISNKYNTLLTIKV